MTAESLFNLKLHLLESDSHKVSPNWFEKSKTYCTRAQFAKIKNKYTNAVSNLHFALHTSDLHSQLSLVAWGQQNRGINRVAKVPSLIPPRKMHAFNFLCFVNFFFFFLNSENETMQKQQPVWFSFIPGVSQYNNITNSVPWTIYYNYFKAHFI